MSRAIDPRLAVLAALSLTLLLAAPVGVAAFTPAPSAPSLGGLDGPLAAVDPDDSDRPLDSGSVFWAGQRVFFDGSAVLTDADSQTARTFQLRAVTTDDRVGSLVKEFVVDADGEAIVDLASLEGEYLVVYQGDPVYVQDGAGAVEYRPDGGAVTVETSAWEVATQSLSASWFDDRVFRNDEADLRIRSNRGRFDVEVSAEGVDFETLESMFAPADFAADHDREAADDVIVLSAGGDASLPVTFAALDNGLYTLHIAVADADAATTATIRVGRPRTATPSPSPSPSPSPTTGPATTVAPTVTPTAPPTPTPVPTANRPTPTGTATRATPTAAPGQPGFGAVAATVGLIVAALAWHRRPG